MMEYPPIEYEPFTVADMKLLTMMLLENRGGLDYEKGLTPHGHYILASVQRKLAINVLGIDTEDFGVPAVEQRCACCGAAIYMTAQLDSLAGPASTDQASGGV